MEPSNMNAFTNFPSNVHSDQLMKLQQYPQLWNDFKRNKGKLVASWNEFQQKTHSRYAPVFAQCTTQEQTLHMQRKMKDVLDNVSVKYAKFELDEFTSAMQKISTADIQIFSCELAQLQKQIEQHQKNIQQQIIITYTHECNQSSNIF